MSQYSLSVDGRRLRWFDTSPDAGPDCLCSLCGKPIEESDIPLRIFDQEKDLEARLHTGCWNQVSPDKIYAPSEVCDEQDV